MEKHIDFARELVNLCNRYKLIVSCEILRDLDLDRKLIYNSIVNCHIICISEKYPRATPVSGITYQGRSVYKIGHQFCYIDPKPCGVLENIKGLLDDNIYEFVPIEVLS